MKTYHFATVDGEVPSQLVGHERDGATVVAFAPLDGPDHNLFLAIDADDIEVAGAVARDLPVPGMQVAYSLSPCDSLPCKQVIDFVKSMVADLDGFEIYLYLLIELDGDFGHIGVLIDSLGENAVAAVTDGHGHVLLELGAHSREDLQHHLDVISKLPHVRRTTAHWAQRKHRA